MDNQKILIGTLIIAVINFALGFLWYDVLMADFFPTMDGASRIPPNFIAIILGVLFFSYAFARLFDLAQNAEDPLIGQAIRFGLLIGLMTAVASSLFRFGGMQIWSGMHNAVDAIYGVVVSIVIAIVLAKYYGPKPMKGGGGGGEDDDGDT